MNQNGLSHFLSALNLESHPWLWQVTAVIMCTLIASYIVRFLAGRLELQFKKTKNLWDDALFEAGRKPIFYAVWLLGLSWLVDILKSVTQAAIFENFTTFLALLVVVLLTWFLLRLVLQVEQRLKSLPRSQDVNDATLDETTINALGKLFRITIIITAALMLLQGMGYSISGVLAFGGIGGIAVGFAAKDLLSNFFGGLMIYLDRPFAIGDWIRSPDKEIEGTVQHIGWRQTRILTFDKRPLYIPNATFAQIAVENPSRMSNRRIYETIGVRYDDAPQIKAIVEQVREMLRNHPDIDSTQTLIVNFNAFAPSSMDFFVYTFTKTTDWVAFHEIKQNVMLAILDIILNNEADVAFPTSTLKVADEVLIKANASGESTAGL